MVSVSPVPFVLSAIMIVLIVLSAFSKTVKGWIEEFVGMMLCLFMISSPFIGIVVLLYVYVFFTSGLGDVVTMIKGCKL